MARLMAAEGLPYGERTMTYNSRLAQELAKWAETQAAGKAIHDVLFRAYFVHNVNLASSHHLVQIAEQIGLDPEKARGILEARHFQAAVDEDWHRSRQLGITGVPTFVVGDRAVVGAQPYETLENMLLESGVARR